MASKVLVPAAPFAKLQVKKSPPEQGGSGFIIGSGDAVARVAHLEHSVRFLQEQHRLMLSGLHAEIEALRERNRDLQFQLIFNKESPPKSSPPAPEEKPDNTEEVGNLKKEVTRLEREAAAARGEARAAEARALQLQRTVDVQADKLRELELKANSVCQSSEQPSLEEGADETRAELRARLTEAERLVRRLRGDAERQRREVLAATADGVTNLLFDGAHARHAHLQCMKNSLHASLRASGLDGYGYQNNYHFPPLHPTEFWREPLREEYSVGGARGAGGGGGAARARRPLTLPELAGPQLPRSTVYANNHPRPRANGYDHKKKPVVDPAAANTPEDPQEHFRPQYPRTNEISTVNVQSIRASIRQYPELKMVVTKMISQDNAMSSVEARRPRRHPRRHAPDHT
ncbi:uncharacterized protein LOC126371742 isoform X2 [Pectinophora gossypiella]|uniref:uncharacterized protein LOC126371742 isoform X2 n=1 Tax=Pectinophora gossypiella TaxID=13191 RepID=UPI00214ED352|nr:uncharacterized protein LOC126371742 isoform X2 [Pectinophora gossypiella]